MMRFNAARITLLLIGGLAVAGCSGDDTPDAAGNRDATTTTDTGIHPDATTNPMDAGDGGTTGMDVDGGTTPPPCPQGAEGCPCTTAGMCDPDLTCVDWPIVFQNDPQISTCVRLCSEAGGECANSDLPTPICRDFFLGEDRATGEGLGTGGACVSAEAPIGAACKGSRRGMRTATGCEGAGTCLTQLVGGDEGVCGQLCVVSTSTPTGGCEAPTPYCNPRASGLTITSTAMVVTPVGVCAEGAIAVGSACSQDDPTRSCDTATIDPNLLLCVGVPGAAMGTGFCQEFCELASPTCLTDKPGVGRYECTPGTLDSTTVAVCTSGCSQFPDNCDGQGAEGLGETCSNPLQFNGAMEGFSWCLDVQGPTLGEQVFDVNNGMVVPRAGTGENCEGMAGEPYRCPNGTFCLIPQQGQGGVCVRGCTTSTTAGLVRGGCELNAATSSSAVCFPDPRFPGEEQLCAEP